jgi:UDP-galactose transporter B1
MIHRFPEVLTDVLLFSFAGAVGQLVIFYNIREFGSVASTTITVTRCVPCCGNVCVGGGGVG